MAGLIDLSVALRAGIDNLIEIASLPSFALLATEDRRVLKKQRELLILVAKNQCKSAKSVAN